MTDRQRHMAEHVALPRIRESFEEYIKKARQLEREALARAKNIAEYIVDVLKTNKKLTLAAVGDLALYHILTKQAKLNPIVPIGLTALLGGMALTYGYAKKSMEDGLAGFILLRDAVDKLIDNFEEVKRALKEGVESLFGEEEAPSETVEEEVIYETDTEQSNPLNLTQREEIAEETITYNPETQETQTTCTCCTETETEDKFRTTNLQLLSRQG